jgi:hypothetical protein
MVVKVQKGRCREAVTSAQQLTPAIDNLLTKNKKLAAVRSSAADLLPHTIIMSSSGPSAASQKKRKLSGESPLNC